MFRVARGSEAVPLGGIATVLTPESEIPSYEAYAENAFRIIRSVADRSYATRMLAACIRLAPMPVPAGTRSRWRLSGLLGAAGGKRMRNRYRPSPGRPVRGGGRVQGDSGNSDTPARADRGVACLGGSRLRGLE